MEARLALALLIAIPILAAPLIYLFGRIVVLRKGEKNTSSPARWLALLALAAAGYEWYLVWVAFQGGASLPLTVGTVSLQADGISMLLSAVVLVLGFLVTIFSGPYMGAEVGEEKFYAMLTASIGAIIGLGCATDLFNLWVWFEVMAVTTYLLVAFYRNQASSLEAGLKYVVQSAVGSVFILIGIALVFLNLGTLSLTEIHAAAGSNSILLVTAGALFLIGFGVKTALVPLHTWLPDAHSMAPSGISAMLSGIVIEAGLVALLRALGALYFTNAAWGPIILGFAAVNMLFGNLMALRQTQVKRMLAYSSLSHMGYILLGIGFAMTFGVANGATGSFFHLLNHAFMKGLAFLGAGAFMYVLFISRGEHKPLELEDLNGASKRYPLAAFGLCVALLALGGLPPFSGFMSKMQIFLSGIESLNVWAVGLVVFAALNSVLSLGYYAPLVNRIYRLEPSKAVQEGKKMPVAFSIVILVLAAAVVVLGIWPNLITVITQPAGASLMALFGL